jgi:hypothetical protein
VRSKVPSSGSGLSPPVKDSGTRVAPRTRRAPALAHTLVPALAPRPLTSLLTFDL